MEGNWWKLLVLGAVILGLIWWRSGGQEPEMDESVLQGAQLEQQVNEFLEDQNLTLPEGSERANLAAKDGSSSTGVASRVAGDDAANFSVLASLNALESGVYAAALVNDANETMPLGTLSVRKGGYILESSLTNDVAGYDTVRVTDPKGVTVLEGTFATDDSE